MRNRINWVQEKDKPSEQPVPPGKPPAEPVKEPPKPGPGPDSPKKIVEDERQSRSGDTAHELYLRPSMVDCRMTRLLSLTGPAVAWTWKAFENRGQSPF
jgi:hypothetical protein